MRDPWEVVVEAGVPVGPPRAGVRFDPGEAAAAARALLAEPSRLSERERAALAAWLAAWRAEWPSSFARAFGADGRALADRAMAMLDDPGRYLKLRRIAREALAGAL